MSAVPETSTRRLGRTPSLPRQMVQRELERNASHSRLGGLAAGLTPQQISGATGLELKLVRVTLNNMQGAGQVANIGTHNKPRWCLATAAEAVARLRHSKDENHYNGAELRRNVGLPAERFRAFELPSRMGDWLHWPDGRVTPVVKP